jgi:hypothetical protein
LTGQHAEKTNTGIDSIFGRIIGQVPFVFDHATIHIERTAHTPRPSQTTDFQTQKGMRTLLFSVRATFNGTRSTGATPGHTLWTIMISLPQFVLGHVSIQQFITHVPLATPRKQSKATTL